MKVLLCMPPLVLTKDNLLQGAHPPHGIAYIASTVRAAGHSVKILDCYNEGIDNAVTIKDKVRIGLSEKAIIQKIKDFSPSFIGISGNFTAYSQDALSLAKLIKEHFPDTVICLGGSHFSTTYAEVVQLDYVDFVIVGEGEDATLELVNAIEQEAPIENLKNIPGVASLGELGQVHMNPRALAEDVDVYSPAYDLLNMDIYLHHTKHTLRFAKRTPIGHMFTSRGCNYKCVFCCQSKHFKKFRPRSPKSVIKEIKQLTEEYGAKEIVFHDDNMIEDVGRAIQICNEIVKQNINISWHVAPGVPVWKLTDDLLTAMKESGMYRITFPIESGSKNSIKYIKKPINHEKALKLIEKSASLGLYTAGNFIIGLPHETESDINATRDFICKSKLDAVHVAIAQPFPGTNMYNDFNDHGLLISDREGSTYYRTKIDTVHLKAETINAMRTSMIKDFTRVTMKKSLTPKGFMESVLPKLDNLEAIKYFARMAFLMVNDAIHKRQTMP